MIVCILANSRSSVFQIRSKRGLSQTSCLLLSLALSGCAAVIVPPTEDNLDVVRSWISPQWPQSTSDYRTTSGDIYLANLNASISSLERLYKNNPSARTGTPLADRLYHRYKILGRFEDAELALATIREVIQQHEASPDSLISFANIQAGFHLFTEALDALDLAKSAGADPGRITSLSTEIHTALGNYDFSVSAGADYRSNVAAAHRALLKGNLFLASSLFRDAEFSYTGTGPYILAWIQLQQGIAFLRYGDAQSANHFFKYAHNRLPQYFLVTEHLAESELLLGNTETALGLYQVVSEQTNNPAFYAQLARAQVLVGDDHGSRHSISMAKAGFEELLEKHPQSVGDHAVTFYLGQGENEMALKIARQNISIRQNIESWVLLIQASLAAGERAEACKAWTAANQLGVRPVELRILAGTMTGTC